MGKYLVIVESPTKAKTISGILNDSYEVISSMGHIVDLPSHSLGINIEKGFIPTYRVIPRKEKIANILKKKAKKKKIIYLATDSDREGEAISWHIKNILAGTVAKTDFKDVVRGPVGLLKDLRTNGYINKQGLIQDEFKAIKDYSNMVLSSAYKKQQQEIYDILQKHLAENSKKFYRVVFHEITETAIKQSFQHAGHLDMYRVNAQKVRRILDRIVGYCLSPLLWKKIARGLSAGRVQSIALKFIVARERDIEKFIPVTTYSVEAEFKAANTIFKARLVKAGSEKGVFSKKEEAFAVGNALKQEKFFVRQIRSEEHTSELQSH